MISDFDPDELGLVAAILERRYGHAIALECAEAEIALDPGSAATTTCPALYWEARGAHFVVCKTGEARYRGQFFEAEAAPRDLSRNEYADLGDCATDLLRLQADHERTRAAGAPA